MAAGERPPGRRGEGAGSLAPPVPPLRAGDRLSLEEFERRYDAMPHLKKAELIEGVVYMPSPVNLVEHGEPHAAVMLWLGTYWMATPGVQVGDSATVRLDARNELQPDAFLLIDFDRGGQARVGPQGYVEGAPELVFEVAASSTPYDLREKRQVYERNGVQEYVIWQVRERRLLWLRLRAGALVPLEAGPDGVLASEVFPGLRLAVEALLAGDLRQVVAELQAGLDTPAHRAFVARLAGTRRE